MLGRFGIIICLLLNGLLGYGQILTADQLDTAKVYKSIDKALENPDQVYILELKRDRLTEFPMAILRLRNLQVLDLSHNRLSGLPPNLNELKYLQEISIHKNKFTSLPLSICDLGELRRLTISRNKIRAFPVCISQLSNLEVIDAWDNELVIFPDGMSKLMNLKYLDLNNINYSDTEKHEIQVLMPNTEIKFSNGCNCGG